MEDDSKTPYNLRYKSSQWGSYENQSFGRSYVFNYGYICMSEKI